MFELIAGKSPYKSPTDMGVNMAGNCIVDDEVCREASRKEIVRRYFKCLCQQKITGTVHESERYSRPMPAARPPAARLQLPLS